MNRAVESSNKALVLEALDTLFNKRDYVAAERYWSPDYIQHSAHIEPGCDGLFNLIKSVPATLTYEPGVIVADGDFVIVHGRFSGHGRPKSWIAADILRIVDGVRGQRDHEGQSASIVSPTRVSPRLRPRRNTMKWLAQLAAAAAVLTTPLAASAQSLTEAQARAVIAPGTGA